MARITVEDCLENINNRFSLVMISAQRTKQLLKGHRSLIENNKDNKEVVVSLREVADGVVGAADENFDESETMLAIAGPNSFGYTGSDTDFDLPSSI
jgi:DNA-directed RNA polymerase subunit omega